jgi:hypothetical protein
MGQANPPIAAIQLAVERQRAFKQFRLLFGFFSKA